MLEIRRFRSLLPKVLASALMLSLLTTHGFVLTAFAQAGERTATTRSATVSYVTDLTRLAAANKLSVSSNFDSEVSRLIRSLASDSQRQPVILDSVGKDQSLIVDALAARIANGDVPENLSNVRVLRLELEAVFADKTKAAERFDAVIDELAQSSDKTVLFVDELTNFVGNSQISAKLSDSLLNGKIRLIGGSSTDAYTESIEPVAEVAAMFETITIGDRNISNSDSDSNLGLNSEGFRGDNVSSDLRDMMANDPTGKRRVDVIVQAKDADDPSLRALLSSGKARLTDRIGDSNTLVVNLPLALVNELSQSRLANFISPDRQTLKLGHVENTTGTAVTRSQAATTGRAGVHARRNRCRNRGPRFRPYPTHADFKNASGASRIVYSQNFVTTESTTDDNYGHGTHVAGLAATLLNG
ncbi:MAG: hypothetical protein IPK58_05795 [Acidobacteria bacterium]|nr:hypothetical protein [Acidobacteriota bacterium]